MYSYKLHFSFGEPISQHNVQHNLMLKSLATCVPCVFAEVKRASPSIGRFTAWQALIHLPTFSFSSEQLCCSTCQSKCRKPLWLEGLSIFGSQSPLLLDLGAGFMLGLFIVVFCLGFYSVFITGGLCSLFTVYCHFD